MATVTEIQVCGERIYKTLLEACLYYAKCVSDGVNREKLLFAIRLTNGETKHITIRQEPGRVVAYGDFEGLPSFLDYAGGKE